MKDSIESIFHDIRSKVSKSDRGLWGACGALTLVSILLMYSTTDVLGNPLKNTISQIKFFIVAYFIMAVLHYFHYSFVRKLARYLLIIIFILLFSLTFFGDTINGATRWLTLPVVGFRFQPSEFIKIFLVLHVARTLAIFQEKDRCSDIAFWRIIIYSSVVCLWIAISDFSTAVLIGATIFVMLCVGRIRRKLILGMLATLILLVSILVFTALVTDWRPNMGRFPTMLNRIERFLTPEKASHRRAIDFAKLKTKAARNRFKRKEKQKTEEKSQVEAALAAIGTGGIVGKGLGNSDVHYVLPLPYSDYVFAIIVEELGLLVAAFLVLAYVALVYRAGDIAKRCRSAFPAFLVIGLTTIIVLQAFMNMAVALSLVPVTGQPLPFVSKGGSSLLATGVALGLIMSVTYWLKKEAEINK